MSQQSQAFQSEKEDEPKYNLHYHLGSMRRKPNKGEVLAPKGEGLIVQGQGTQVGVLSTD